MFLYAFMSGASISFPHLFLRSLNEVHRSSNIGHALIYPIFIHRILLFLGLADFPASEPVHVVGPLGTTFLRQRAAHLRADPLVSRGASSSRVPPPPSSTGVAAVATDVPPPTTSDDSDIRRTLDHVLTVQAAQGQILVDILDEIRGLRADLARFRSSSSPPPFDDGFLLPFGIPSQKEGVHMRCFWHLYLFLFLGGEFIFCWLELVELFRLYIGALLCTLPF